MAATRKPILSILAGLALSVAVIECGNADPVINGVLNYTEARLAIRDEAGAITGVQISNNGRFAAVSFEHGGARIWDLQAGLQRGEITGSRQFVSAFIDDSGMNFVGATSDGAIQAFDALSGTVQAILGNSGDGIGAASISADGRVIATAGGRIIRIWTRHDPLPVTVATVTLDADVTAIAVNSDGSRILTGDSAGNIEIWDVKLGRPMGVRQKVGDRVARVGFIRAGTAIFAGTESGEAGIWRSDAGAEILPPRKLASHLTAMAVDSPGRRLAIADGEMITVFDAITGRVVGKMSGYSGAITGLGFDLEAKHLLSAGTDGKIRIWDLQSQNEALQISSTKSGWIAIDGEGRFDGSEEGINAASWLTSATVIPLQNFSPDFFEGGIVRAYWSGQTKLLSPTPGSFKNGKIPLPPKVEIDDLPKGRQAGQPLAVIVVASDEGGGIGPIHLYHNGKLIDDSARIEQQDIEKNGRHLRAVAFRVTPVPGPNTFKGVSTSLWNIEGQSDETTAIFDGSSPPIAVHILAVGISHYIDPKLTLDYSTADANAVVAETVSAANTVYSQTKQNVLLDGAATASNIRHALSDLKNTNEQDIIVIYLAGHGLVAKGEWMFMPYETRLLKSAADYVGKGITASEIRDALVAAPARQILLMIDACSSGAGIEDFEQFQTLQRAYLRDVSRTVGITALAAARKNQVAVEATQLGHGLFTSAVISGLKGGARLNDAGGSALEPVTAHELARFTTKQIRIQLSHLIPIAQASSNTSPPTRSIQVVEQQESYLQEAVGYALGADFVLRK